MTEHEQQGVVRPEEKAPIFTIDGVEVSAPTCDHCGAIPTEADAIKLVRGITDPTCAMCRKQIFPTRLTLKHWRDDKWGWAQIVYKEQVSMQLWLDHGSVHVECHRKCAENAFPMFYKAVDTPKS